MSFSMNLWRVGKDGLEELPPTRLDLEQRLEGWIEKDPSILGLDLLIIGRQVQTPYGGRIDLLALDQEANCVVLELKRDRTPRDIVAQILDYASWAKDLTYPDLDQLTTGHRGKSLADAFKERFEQPIPETVNAAHSMVLVASELDDSSERIIDYLSEQHRVNINAVFFETFKSEGTEFLGRAWLKDPVEMEERSGSAKQSPWTGFWFANVGEGPRRTWEDNQRYGYLSAGGSPKYSKPVRRFHVGDRLFAYLKGYGYVGFGQVASEAVMIRDFLVIPEKKRLLDAPLKAAKAAENCDDPDLSEWAVGVKWFKTFSRDDARTFKGIATYRSVVCKLRDQDSLEFLRREFGAE